MDWLDRAFVVFLVVAMLATVIANAYDRFDN